MELYYSFPYGSAIVGHVYCLLVRLKPLLHHSKTRRPERSFNLPSPRIPPRPLNPPALMDSGGSRRRRAAPHRRQSSICLSGAVIDELWKLPPPRVAAIILPITADNAPCQKTRPHNGGGSSQQTGLMMQEDWLSPAELTQVQPCVPLSITII